MRSWQQHGNHVRAPVGSVPLGSARRPTEPSSNPDLVQRRHSLKRCQGFDKASCCGLVRRGRAEAVGFGGGDSACVCGACTGTTYGM